VNLLPWRRKPEPVAEVVERDAFPLAFNDFLGMLQQFGYQGLQYTLPSASQEEIGGTYQTLAQLAYRNDAPVFACMAVRMLLFSEARFQWRQLRSGRRAILHADLGGNFFAVRRGQRIRVLRPDWVTIIMGSQDEMWDVDADVLGYAYQPGGPGSGRDPQVFAAEDVAHFAPIPDPLARYRGMSWLTPVVREIMGDKAATDHKLRFFENGATPNLVIKTDATDLERFKEYQRIFADQHEGIGNAYKTLFFAQGWDATVVGSDLRQLAFKDTQGAGETRIAAAAGVPPVIVGLSEGLQSATYSNYGQARRRFADGTLRPLWRNFAGSMSRIVRVPAAAELWYDDRDVPFLKEDLKDAADIQAAEAGTIRQLVDAGFTPESCVDAVVAGDFTVLQHTGLFSVQLQPPMTEPPTPEPGLEADPEPAVAGANGTRDQRELVAAPKE
jgi:hypothetical protein